VKGHTPTNVQPILLSEDRKLVTNPRWQVILLNEPRMIKYHPNPDKLSPELRQGYFVPKPQETDNNINIIMYFIYKEIGKKILENLSSIIREQGQFTIEDVFRLRIAALEKNILIILSFFPENLICIIMQPAILQQRLLKKLKHG
jgi:hypothetical protein